MIRKLLLISALITLCISCGKKDGPHNGEFPPKLFIILNDIKDNSLLPIPEDGRSIALTDYKVIFEIDGEPLDVEIGEDLNELRVQKETQANDELSLCLFTEKFASILFRQAGKDHKYQCHVKITLTCREIFNDEKEHMIDIDMKYSGNRHHEIMAADKNSVYIDRVQAECLRHDLYKANLDIK